MGYNFDFSWVGDYLPAFLRAFVITLQLLGLSAVLSVVIGLLAGQMLTSKRRWVALPVRFYVDLFRLTPILLQIVVIFFLLPNVLHLQISTLLSGVIALSLNYGAFNAEIFRAGILSVDRGQWEASAALGMTWLQSLRRVVYPQAVRRMLPPLGSMLIALTKDTSLISVIGVTELFNVAQSVGAQTFRQLESFFVIAGFYLVLTLPMAVVASYMTRRINRNA
jgi:His/Glu/Gln/Arg/opine family amino acid ABC transporter permease subunit